MSFAPPIETEIKRVGFHSKCEYEEAGKKTCFNDAITSCKEHFCGYHCSLNH